LGWLARTDQDKEKSVLALIQALKDNVMEVRRNAAEALGRIGDARAVEVLRVLTNPEKEKEDWVRSVAEESLGLIRVKNAALSLPDKAALTALTEGLKHKEALVRRTSAELLAKGGPDAIGPLTDALKDEDDDVRKNVAKSLGEMGDKRAVELLRKALVEEKDVDAKKAMEDSIAKLQEEVPRERDLADIREAMGGLFPVWVMERMEDKPDAFQPEYSGSVSGPEGRQVVRIVLALKGDILWVQRTAENPFRFVRYSEAQQPAVLIPGSVRDTGRMGSWIDFYPGDAKPADFGKLKPIKSAPIVEAEWSDQGAIDVLIVGQEKLRFKVRRQQD